LPFIFFIYGNCVFIKPLGLLETHVGEDPLFTPKVNVIACVVIFADGLFNVAKTEYVPVGILPLPQ
jgi:hypothetical protein